MTTQPNDLDSSPVEDIWPPENVEIIIEKRTVHCDGLVADG